MSHPYKSTTHEELYHHHRAFNRPYSHITLFLRKEAGGWEFSWALCSAKDQFSRRVGRSVARRRYFQGQRGIAATQFPDGKLSEQAIDAAVLTVIKYVDLCAACAA